MVYLKTAIFKGYLLSNKFNCIVPPLLMPFPFQAFFTPNYKS